MGKNLKKGGAQLYVLLMLVLILGGFFYNATRDKNLTFVEQVKQLFNSN